MAPHTQLAAGIIPQEFLKGGTVGIVATVAGHGGIGPRIYHVGPHRVVCVFTICMATETYRPGGETIGWHFGQQVRIMAGCAIAVINLWMPVGGLFVGFGLCLMAGTTNDNLGPRQ